MDTYSQDKHGSVFMAWRGSVSTNSGSKGLRACEFEYTL